MMLCVRAAAVLILLSVAARAAEEESYKIQVYGWSYGRERKTVTSSNRVTANFTIKNTGPAALSDVALTLTYRTGLGEAVANPIVKKIGAVKAGETQKVALVGDFIPVFDSYELIVDYAPRIKEIWFSNSDVGQPEPKNGQPVHGTASLVILGKEASPGRSGRFAGAVRVKNEGTVEAKNLKIFVTFFDTKKQKIGEWSDKLGAGTLAGGAEANLAFVCPKAPALYGGYELKVSCDDTSAEAALSGGEFSGAGDVEFAHFQFKRSDPKSPDLKVSAKVRNGLGEAVEQVSLTLAFMNAKKKELKRHTYAVPGRLKPGEIQACEFTVASLPAYDAFEESIAYKKAGTAPAEHGAKAAAAKFQNLNDIEVIFTDSVTHEDKSVSLAGALRNGRNSPVRNVAIAIEFTKGGTPFATAEKIMTDVVQPGEERNFVVKAPAAAGFSNYSFHFKYAELNDRTSP